jgi:hypothetical protein
MFAVRRNLASPMRSYAIDPDTVYQEGALLKPGQYPEQRRQPQEVLWLYGGAGLDNQG